MKEYIDRMLHLTADIAEELLTLKDTDTDISPELCDKIITLGEIAAQHVGGGDADEPFGENPLAEVEAMESVAVESNELLEGQHKDVTEREKDIVADVEISESAEEEQEADATVPIPEPEENNLPEEETAAHEEEATEEVPAEVENIDDFVDENAEEHDEYQPAEYPAESVPETITTQRNDYELPETPLTAEPQPDEEFPENNNGPEIAQSSEFEETEEAEDAEVPDEPVQPYDNGMTEAYHPHFTPGEIRNAFTLNDIFLYQRVLFGGVPQRFKDTLEAIAQCRDMDEVRAYLADVQKVNVRSDEAKDFMDIVRPFVN